MKLIYWFIFSFTYIRSKRLSVIIVRRLIVRLSVFLDKISNKGIWASRIIRRIRQRDNVLILADGEAFNIADLINVLFGQLSFFHVLSPYLLTTMRSFSASLPFV